MGRRQVCSSRRALKCLYTRGRLIQSRAITPRLSREQVVPVTSSREFLCKSSEPSRAVSSLCLCRQFTSTGSAGCILHPLSLRQRDFCSALAPFTFFYPPPQALSLCSCLNEPGGVHLLNLLCSLTCFWRSGHTQGPQFLAHQTVLPGVVSLPSETTSGSVAGRCPEVAPRLFVVHGGSYRPVTPMNNACTNCCMFCESK